VKERTRDTDIVGSNPPYFFLIYKRKQDLRRKAENIDKLVSCKNICKFFLPLVGFEPLPVGEDLKLAAILMYWVVKNVGNFSSD